MNSSDHELINNNERTILMALDASTRIGISNSKFPRIKVSAH